MLTQIWHFIIHLRLHYQFFILSGGYLLAGLFVDDINWEVFGLQFLNVHILLFGGATAYNSYWDKDNGPIGGLKNPPKMTRWMWVVSLLLQYLGLIWSFVISLDYLIIYAFSMLFFWLYSTPLVRWKGKPILSLVAIGLSTGTNSFLLGFLAASGRSLDVEQGVTAFGVACIFLSLYPVSQVFQIDEDRMRGDQTFSMKYGIVGVRRLFAVLFITGVLIVSGVMYATEPFVSLLFFFVSLPAYAFIIYQLFRLKGEEHEYPMVMKMKFLASLSFVLFILSVLLVKSVV